MEIKRTIGCILIGGLFFNAVSVWAQSPTKKVLEMWQEVNGYVTEKTKELVSQGKRIDAAKRSDLENDKKTLADKYAEEAAARPDLKGVDLYYLGELFVIAEDDTKALDAMKKFLAQYPPETKGDAIQSARSYIMILSARKKLLPEADQAYQEWLKGEPSLKNQQPALEQVLAAAYFRDKQYDKAIKYAQHAFDLLKTTESKSIAEKRSKEKLYMNLVEVLSLSYKKNDDKENALNILAEARVQSFALPSADLYRKVMDFVGGSGFSEKKLMQKVESFPAADSAPELAIKEWIGTEPMPLKSLRGKVVLLDFWATWCGPCISTFPRLRGWHKKYGGSDFVIVGVTRYYGNVDGKTMSPLQELDFLGEFKEKYKMPYAIAVAERGEDSAKYGINAYPTTVLLDRNGVVRYIGIGAGAEESANLEDMIKEVIKEKERRAVSTPE